MEGNLFYITLPKRNTAPSAVTVAPQREIAYYIKDTSVPRFAVYKSANAWWMDSAKLNRIIYHLKEGRLIREALVMAGVSQYQWQYFNDTHPDFSSVREACQTIYDTMAFRSLNAGIKKDPNLAFRVLSKTHEKFKTAPRVDTPPVVQQTVNIAATTATVQNVDTTKIEDVLTRAVERFFIDARREGSSTGRSGQGLEAVGQN